VSCVSGPPFPSLHNVQTLTRFSPAVFLPDSSRAILVSDCFARYRYPPPLFSDVGVWLGFVLTDLVVNTMFLLYRRFRL